MKAIIDLSDRVDRQHVSSFVANTVSVRDLSDIPGTRARLAAVRENLPETRFPGEVTMEDRSVSGPAGAPDIRLKIYKPVALGPGAPAFFWIHGGGMVMGDVEQDNVRCAKIAKGTGALVASVDYRLAPEHPFPAPLEDCYAGLKGLVSLADEFQLDLAHLAIGGGSAGGGLAAGLALLARDKGEVAVCFQLLMYPMLDDRNVTASSHEILDERVWNRASNLAGWNAYLAGKAGSDDVSPYAAPARATDLAGLPPAYINVGELDLFLDEDIAYARALTAAGTPVELHVYPGAYHGSTSALPSSSLSCRWHADEIAALVRAFEVS